MSSNNPASPFNTGVSAAPNAASPFGTPRSTEEEVWEVDMSQSTSGLVPAGTYKMRVQDVVRELSKAGDPMYTWTMEIVDGNYAGKTMKTWTSLSPQALFRFEEVAAAIGFNRNEDGKIQFTKADALHRLFIGTIEDDTYQGRATSKLEGLQPWPEGVGMKAVPANRSAAPI